MKVFLIIFFLWQFLLLVLISWNIAMTSQFGNNLTLFMKAQVEYNRLVVDILRKYNERR